MLPSDPLMREHIRIDRDLQIEDDGINAYIETWFDVDGKFSVNIRDDDRKWVNFYATYNPDTDTIKCIYIVESDDDNQDGVYNPLPEEVALIKSMMEETCMQEFGCNLCSLWAERQ